MKKCIHCGREIPDDAAFCGFCGTPQPEENNHSEEKKETDHSENEVEEKPSDDQNSVIEEETEDSSENTHEIRDAEIVESSEEKNSEKEAEKPEESDSVADEKTDEDNQDEKEEPEDSSKETHEIKDAEIVETSSEKKEEESDDSEETSSGETEDHDTATEEKDPEKKKHVNLKKISLPKINVSKEDFSKLLEILEKPEENHGIDNTTTWIILIFVWIANWVAFGSFTKGFFSLLIILIGLVFLNWLTLKDHATFGETVRNSAEVLFTPSVLVFAGGLFIRNIRAGAEVYAFHSIFTTAFIGLFFLTAALILFLLTVIKKYEMKVWQIVLILTVFVSLLFWYLLTGGAISLLY